MWIESMNGLEIQCITQVLRKDIARLDTNVQSQMDKINSFIWKRDIGLASETVPSSSCAPSDMQWSRLGIWGM